MATVHSFKQTADSGSGNLRPADPPSPFVLEAMPAYAAQWAVVMTRVSLVGVVLTSIIGCAAHYGPAFPNSARTKGDVYLYGDHSTGRSADEDEPASELVEADAPSEALTEKESAASDSKQTPSASKEAPDGEEVDVELEVTAITPGTYRGTDWVTIDLPGFPGSEQVDDKARVVVAALADSSRLTFTVLDTNSGNELCTVEAELIDALMAFDAGQACFGGILGVPMETSVYEGEGRTANGILEVSLSVELTLTSPDGDEIVGDLSYRFEGKLTDDSAAGH